MSDAQTLVPREGWHVLHLYYRVDRAAWGDLPESDRAGRAVDFVVTVNGLAADEGLQLIPLAVVGPKADLGFMVIGADLHVVQAAEKRLQNALGPGLLAPAFGYLSLTEQSEYTTTETEYAAQVVAEKGLAEGSPEFDAALAEFRARMAKYRKDKLNPVLPPWPVLCFYPMSKRRSAAANWYALPFDTRKRLMAGHARVGRKWAGKILQLITGSTGLDAMEWGVTLLAHDTAEIKAIVYEMRFDPVSAEYAEFGDFYIGLRLEPLEILKRLALV
jgi:chlorite dismutase